MNLTRLLFPLGMGLLGAACTLLGSRDLVQCATDGDCASATDRPVCVDGLCARTTSGSSSSGEAGDAPVGDAPEGGPDGAVDECPCPQNPDPQLCVGKKCVKLVSPECPTLVPSNQPDLFKAEGAVVVGIWATGVTGGTRFKTIDRALTDISAQLTAAGRPPIGALLCAKNHGKVGAALAHLQTLAVPTFIGQFETSELFEIAKDGPSPIGIWSTLGIDKNAYPLAPKFLNHRYLADELARLGTSGIADGVAVALDEVVKRRGTVPRVVVLRNNEPEYDDLRAKVESLLVNRVDQGKITKISDKVIPTAYEKDLTATSYLSIGQNDVRSTAAEVLIALGGDEMEYVLEAADPTFPAPKPHWIVGPRVKYDSISLLDAANKGSSDLEKRLIGVDFPGNFDIQRQFSSLFPPDPNKGIGAVDNLYDAMHVLAFATVAASRNRTDLRAPLAASAMNAGLDDVLSGGTAFVLQPSNDGQTWKTFFNAAVNAASVGPLSYTGTTGLWTLDGLRKGVRDVQGFSFFCFAPPSTGTAVTQLSYYVTQAELEARPFTEKCVEP